MPFDSLPNLPVPVELDEVDIILREARNIIEQGWCQNDMHRGDNHCAIGAIRLALGLPKRQTPLYRKSVRRLAKSLPTRYSWFKHSDTRVVMIWNDRPFRTKKQVLAQFDRVLITEKNHMS